MLGTENKKNRNFFLEFCFVSKNYFFQKTCRFFSAPQLFIYVSLSIPGAHPKNPKKPSKR